MKDVPIHDLIHTKTRRDPPFWEGPLVPSFALGKRPEVVHHFAGGVVAGAEPGVAAELDVAGAVAELAAAGSLGLVVVVVVDDGSDAGFSPPQATMPNAIAAKIAAFFMEISSSMYFSNDERGLYFAHQDTAVN